MKESQRTRDQKCERKVMGTLQLLPRGGLNPGGMWWPGEEGNEGMSVPVLL